MNVVRVGIAQINTTVGDLSGNREKITHYIEKARKSSVDIIVFPELSITGYPPKDLLLKKKFIKDNLSALQKIKGKTSDITAVVGFVNEDGGKIYNSAAILQNRKLCAIQNKIHLPNYDVFDEKRYFAKGKDSLLFSSKGICFGVSICEDIWIQGYPTRNQAEEGAEILINISASPYHTGRPAFREKMLKGRCKKNTTALIFNNLVGGQDDLVFDGGSMIIGHNAEVLNKGKLFDEDLIWSDINLDAIQNARLVKRKSKKKTTSPEKNSISLISLPADFKLRRRNQAGGKKIKSGKNQKKLSPAFLKNQEIYNALVLGVKDYVRKNGFKKVVLGLSGGIDSSLVAVIATDALGSKNVTGISMPTSISSSHSIEDAQYLAENLSINFEIVRLQSIFEEYLNVLSPLFKGLKWGVAEENIQARIRGNILMAISNKFGYLLLTTGNKSELSVGYATLYGDMAGGLAVISDVPKTRVYSLSRYRNCLDGKELIPRRCITKPPSAELSPDQKDIDSLPEYSVLDKILNLYVEKDKSLEEIVKQGVDEKTAKEVIMKIDGNEYKRQQAAPGIRITSRAFGSGRRIPITNKYRG